MKYITLHTACPDNGGKRREAGETVGVGTGQDRIGIGEMAKLLDRRLAVSAPAPDAEKA